ncbi:hypothetical protein PG994_001363 [Apiospora phragmitis]|uniref:Uncharacterized protein n=1 Tax=Apiospora phragmitis TaxID=2905665 RepID=A0ABR1WTC1_9PEZI
MEALATECAENIALLHLLHRVPVQPHSNKPSHLPDYEEGGYTLSFEQERHLASVLAFLSSIRNNSNYIPAVCLREKRKPSSLDVLLAVNKAQKDDGNDMLKDLECGFKRLFSILSRVSNVRADATHIEHEAFSAIVTMCSSRILYRLRLRGSTGKPSIEKVLRDTRSSLQKTGLSATLSIFVDTFEAVVKLIDSWSGHQTQHELEALVDGIYRLQQMKEVSSVLNAIPERLMPPNAKRSLVNMISKVARYRECARFLRRQAKKYLLLRKMKVVLVQLGPKAFSRTPVGQLEPNLASRIPQTMSQKKAKKGKRDSLENTCRLLKTTVPQATKVYAQQTRRTLEESKIHAEIQLLFHCDQEKPSFPPRVVCSSKDACFLCNTFILMHGKMHTPEVSREAVPWMATASYSLIKDSIAMLLSRRTKTAYPDPNESTLLILPVSTTTLCSQGTYHSTIQRNKENPSQPPPLKTVEEATVDPSPLKPVSSLTELLPSIIVEDDGQGQNNVRLPEMVSANRTSPVYSDGVLEVHVEYSAGTTAPGGLPKKLPFSIEWLDVEDAERARETQAQHVFDYETTEAEISLSLNDQNSVFISARGSLAKVTFGMPQGGG